MGRYTADSRVYSWFCLRVDLGLERVMVCQGGPLRPSRVAIRRRVWLVLFAMLCVGFTLPAFAQSCPSTDGAGYTFVDTGGSANYNIGPGQSLLIMSGTFNGFINAFPSTARICVNPGATLQPAGGQ